MLRKRLRHSVISVLETHTSDLQVGSVFGGNNIDVEPAVMLEGRGRSPSSGRGEFLSPVNAAVFEALILQVLTHLAGDVADSLPGRVDGARVSFPQLHRIARAVGGDGLFELYETREAVAHTEAYVTGGKRRVFPRIGAILDAVVVVR